MSDMLIKAEFYCGTDIKAAAIHATMKASKWDVDIEFNFNGVKCIAYANGDPDKLEDGYYKALCSKHKWCCNK